jgi:hypothetical protein
MERQAGHRVDFDMGSSSLPVMQTRTNRSPGYPCCQHCIPLTDQRADRCLFECRNKIYPSRWAIDGQNASAGSDEVPGRVGVWPDEVDIPRCGPLSFATAASWIS